jgi:hypothetical protein
MKQTAVEWFAEKIGHNSLMGLIEYNELFEQAKEMEKEQIINAYETATGKTALYLHTFINGETDIYNEPLKIGKDYYNETFKSE